MVKLILFDLDGVLVDAKMLHYEALNQALREIDEKFVIHLDEHLSKYDGLRTVDKLALLTQNKNLPTHLHNQISRQKQKYTLVSFSNITANIKLIAIFDQLKKDGFLLGCCTNSVRRSAFIALSKLGLIEYLNIVLSNEDVKNAKPHPEIYWKAMSLMSCTPEETLILEDAPNGLVSAYRSGAKVFRVNNSAGFSYQDILTQTNMKIILPKIQWQDKNLNVLIPMAGAGTRFEKMGYTFPKPLIDIQGKPMIQLVVESLSLDANYIFIVQKTHRLKYNLDTVLNLIAPGCSIIETDGITEGAACTTLLAKQFINNENPLVIANSDQFIEWNSCEFMYKMLETKCDGGILIFKSTHPKWSYAKTDENNRVIQVAEKNPISEHATVGVYYYKHGSDYVKYAKQMIAKNIRVNNEFYVCPVFNEAIADNKHIQTFEIDKMYGLGTPEDLDYFLKNHIL